MLCVVCCLVIGRPGEFRGDARGDGCCASESAAHHAVGACQGNARAGDRAEERVFNSA